MAAVEQLYLAAEEDGAEAAAWPEPPVTLSVAYCAPMAGMLTLLPLAPAPAAAPDEVAATAAEAVDVDVVPDTRRLLVLPLRTVNPLLLRRRGAGAGAVGS